MFRTGFNGFYDGHDLGADFLRPSCLSCNPLIVFKINNNTEQIRTLTQTRDGLLPRLMSGEVRVEV